MAQEVKRCSRTHDDEAGSKRAAIVRVQCAAIEEGATGIGVHTRERERAGARLDEAASAGDRAGKGIGRGVEGRCQQFAAAQSERST